MDACCLLGYLGLAGYCLMLTGSRMGMLGAVLASILACLASPKRWRLLTLCPVLLVIAWAILPQDRKDRYLTLIDPTKGPVNATSSAGHYRLDGFLKAIPLFEEQPMLGYGPMGFKAIVGHMPHNLYGQLLAELGLAGAGAFGLILLGVAQNAWEARKTIRGIALPDRSLPWDTVLGASAAILLLVIMSWGFNFLYWYVWLWFGGFQVIALQCLKRHAEFADARDFVLSEAPVES